MNKKKIKIFGILGLISMIACLGVGYAFFNYTKEGDSHVVVNGNLYLTLNQGTDSINLTNFFPLSKEEARAETENVMRFSISGKNTTDQDIYY